MAPLPFSPDRKLVDILKESQFTLSAEVIPPRNGANQADVLQQISALVQAGSEFLAVTKGAGGSLRGGSLPIAQLIKERFGVPCIAHFTCRDLTPEEIENQLMDHHYFGIRNILALRGDPPSEDPNQAQRPRTYPYAYQLIEQIRSLNQGQYLERSTDRNFAREATDFCIGAAVYPDHPNTHERIEFFKKKVDAGAEYGITQMLFSPESYSDFLESCARQNVSVPILPGTRLLKSQAQALRVAKRFAVPIPREILETLPADEKNPSPDQIVEVFATLCERFRQAGAPGVHLFVLADTKLCAQVLSRF